jgi:hypothetical protein
VIPILLIIECSTRCTLLADLVAEAGRWAEIHPRPRDRRRTAADIPTELGVLVPQTGLVTARAWLPRTDWWIPVIVGYALVAALFQPLTWPAAAAVLAPGLVMLVVRVRRPAARLPRGARPRRAGVQWGGLLAAFTLWEAVAWFGPNNPDHPTLSLLLDPALERYPVRVLGYLVWLAAGRWLVTR